jgi:YD repeat-containing protein
LGGYYQTTATKPNLLHFTGQRTDATTLQLWLWPTGGTKPATPDSIPKLTNTAGVPIDGWFVYDWSSKPAGTYNYEFQTLDAQNKVLDHVQGTMTLGATPSVNSKLIDTIQPVVTPGSAFNNVIDRSQNYNAFGEVTSETDGRGYTTTFAYNKLGELIKKIDPATSATLENGAIVPVTPTTQYYYNLIGRTIGMRDANGNLSTQRYNAAGLLAAEYHADGGQKLYGYDVFGNRRYMDNELPERTSYSYDAKNQLIRIDHPTDASFKDSNGNGNAPRYDLYQYDEEGRRIKHTNALGNSELTYYDDIGRVKQTTSFGGIVASYRYIYDPVGGGTTAITTEGDGKTLSDTQDYFGRLLAHTDLGGHSFTYQYNQAGWLTHQQGDTNLSVPGLEQNIDYTYYQNGYVKEIIDHGVNSHTKYEYDENGNRTFEGYYQADGGPVYYQWSHATYDALNRVTQIDDPKYNLTYEYDANGNRRHVYARYHDGLQGNVQVQDYWYKYDSMNRFVTTKGTYSGTVVNPDGSHTWNRGTGSIGAGTEGYAITYNAASQRTTANNERYVYAKDGLLIQVFIKDANGVEHLRAERTYDAVGNVKNYVEKDDNGTVTRNYTYTYTSDSRVLTENDGSFTSNYYYDAAGNLIRIYSPQSGAAINTLYAYEYWDTAKQKQIKISGTVTAYQPDLPWKPGFSDFIYDVNGHLTQVSDMAADRHLSYKLDPNGLILQRNELIGVQASRTQYYYYLNGHGVGDAGTFGTSRQDYVTLLASRGQDTNKTGQPVSSADFDYNYQPINDQYPATTPGTYTVKGGDTLQTVSLAVWGDQSLWYLIADANGLADNATLTANQVLVIPNIVANIHNNASTFKVYNPGELIGDTTPTLPDPPPPPVESGGGGCGAFAQVLVIVVTIVVAVFAPELLGIVGEWYAPIIGAAAGNLAGQVTANAVGLQKGINWGSVASSAMTAWVGPMNLPANATWGEIALSAAQQNIVSQGINILTGQQEKFDWKGVVAASIVAPITHSLTKDLAGSSNTRSVTGSSWKGFGADLATGLIKGAVNQGASILVDGKGKMQWSSIAVDSFGNAIGNSINAELDQANRKFKQTDAWQKVWDMNDKLAAKDLSPLYYKSDVNGNPVPMTGDELLTLANDNNDPALRAEAMRQQDALRQGKLAYFSVEDINAITKKDAAKLTSKEKEALADYNYLTSKERGWTLESGHGYDQQRALSWNPLSWFDPDNYKAQGAFQVWKNDQQQQAALAFKGSVHAADWADDLVRFGQGTWDSIHDSVASVVEGLRLTNPGYTIYTAGHSLGGALAQNASLTSGLSGYGFDSLPLSNSLLKGLVKDGDVGKVISDYQAQHEFSNFYSSGEIATTYYQNVWGRNYLDQDPTVLPTGITNRQVSATMGLALLGAVPASWAGAALGMSGLGHSLSNIDLNARSMPASVPMWSYATNRGAVLVP